MGLDTIQLEKTNWGFKGKNYLLLIAIDKYKYWTTLRCTKNDAKKFARILISKYQFEDRYITYLPDSRATLRNILTVFRKLAAKVTENDNLIIYYSGHGHYINKIETGYWVPQSAHVGDEYEDELINTVVILDKLRTIKSLHTFLIVDACFSGSLFTFSTKGTSATHLERHKSRRVFTSGRADQLVEDGPHGGHSPFATALLDVLINNTSRYISASQLIIDIIKNLNAKRQTPQEGRITGDDGGDFVFHVKLSEAEIWANVVKQHDKDVYRKFAQQFPNSMHKAEAVEAYEWLEASETNTIDALTSYLKKYQPIGKYVPMGIKALRALEEEACWRDAKSTKGLSGYFEYLNRYPNGKYAEEAKNTIEKFGSPQDHKALERAFQLFYRGFPPEPAMTLKADEEKAWSEAKEKNTFLSYQTFSQSFEDSKYIPEANLKMKDLDKMALDKIRIEFLGIEKSRVSKKDEIHALEKIKKKCKHYFQEHPAGNNNKQVKQIKDKVEIRLLNLLR